MPQNKVDVTRTAPCSWNPGGEREYIPLSALNHYLFCPRRAALIHVEGIFEDNHHTLRGDLVHEHADMPGYEVAKGVTLLRALPVWSERLGLNGKCDIVEVHRVAASQPVLRSGTAEGGQSAAIIPQPPATPLSTLRSPFALLPVEFKLGKRRKWENDDAQLCAQALCLEEMFALAIPRGAVFHADSKRRREVEFTAELRQRTETAIAALHALLHGSSSSSSSEVAITGTLDPQLPPAEYRDACQECSLFEICLPKATGLDSPAGRLSKQLFQI